MKRPFNITEIERLLLSYSLSARLDVFGFDLIFKDKNKFSL